MSDTPETDAAELIYDGIVASGYADVDVCRKLERERDEAREALRDLCDKIALRMMAENPDKERLDLIESHKRAEAVLAKED